VEETRKAESKQCRDENMLAWKTTGQARKRRLKKILDKTVAAALHRLKRRFAAPVGTKFPK
jgi:hypothetical protein